MDNPILWIIVGVLVVLAVVALVAMMNNKKKKEAQRAEAEQLRQNAAAEQAQLREREDHAQAAAAEADQRRQEADRAAAEARAAEQRAGSVQQEASSLRQNVDEQHRKADLLDPDVDTDKDGFRKDGSRPGGLDDDADRGVHRDHIGDRDDHTLGTDRDRDEHHGRTGALAAGGAAAGAGAFAVHQAGDDHDRDRNDGLLGDRDRDHDGDRGVGDHDGRDDRHDNNDGLLGDRDHDRDGLRHDNRTDNVQGAAAGGSYGLHQQGEPRRDVLSDDAFDDVRDPAQTRQMGDGADQRHHGGVDQQGQHDVDFGDGLAGNSPHGHDGTHDNRDGFGSDPVRSAQTWSNDADQRGVGGERGAHHDDGLATDDHRNGGHGAAAAGAGAAGLGAGAAAAAHHRGDDDHGGTLAEGSHEREQLRDRVSDEDRERYGLGQGDAGQGTMGDVRGDQHHGGYDQQGNNQADFSDGLGGHSPAAGQPGAQHEAGLAGGSWNDGAGDRAHGGTAAAGRDVDYEDGLAGSGGRHHDTDTDAPASVYEQTRQDQQGQQHGDPVGHGARGGFADESTSGWAASSDGDRFGDTGTDAGRLGDTGSEPGRQSWGDTGQDRPATADDYLGAPAAGQHQGDRRDAGQLPTDRGEHLGQGDHLGHGERRDDLGSQGLGHDSDRLDEGQHLGDHDRGADFDRGAQSDPSRTDDLTADRHDDTGRLTDDGAEPQEHKSIGDRIRSLRDDLRGRDQH